MEEIYQFYQAAKYKDETAINRIRSGKVVLSPLHDPRQDFRR